MAIVALAAVAVGGEAAAVEHTFVVTEMKMTHLCNETLVTVVNGQLPGPAIEVTEGDSVAVHVVNNSPQNITIHSAGVPYPARPQHDIPSQRHRAGWHAHVSCLRASLHGAFIIRPQHAYPFPKPDREIHILIGECWWTINLAHLARNMEDGYYNDSSSAIRINGKLGDVYNCSDNHLFLHNMYSCSTYSVPK
ncbi:laccase-15-like [Hordeum vulgare]|nr:laccase-15-like [Hordeum vulgare]